VVTAGSTSGETVMTMDLFPAFAELAGTAPPGDHPIDGIDRMPNESLSEFWQQSKRSK
jgi:hypothetical protein